MEILPGIHSLPAGVGAFMGVYAPNVYLISGKESALIDTGLTDPRMLASRLQYVREKASGRVKYIFVTHGHPDHVGGAVFLKKELGSAIVAHRADEDRLRKTLGGDGIDHFVEDGEQLTVGEREVQAVHTPGHCPGHICYLLPAEGILFSGDHVPGRGTTVIAPPKGDMALYMDSLRRLGSLPLTIVCPGHGPPVKNPRQKIEELLEHRVEREVQLLALLDTSRAKVEELVQRLYPELDHRLHGMARGQILAHLIKLRKEGRAELQGQKWRRIDSRI